MKSNIILIGFMGSGKSTVGKLLAKSLRKEFIDMDDITLSLSKRNSIPDFFAHEGEVRFRELEIKAAHMLSKQRNVVIATGGGIVQNKIIVDYLRRNGVVVFLKTSFQEIVSRIGHTKKRPLFQDKKVAEELFYFRQQLYTAYADIIITTDTKLKVTICDEILKGVNHGRK